MHFLLKQDLERSRIHVKTHALAEESMRVILEAFRPSLSSPSIVKVKNLLPSLEKLHDKKVATHEQWILETGSRSLLNADDVGSIHYSALDVFCDENGKILVIVADHYHGRFYNSFREEYKTLKVPVDFILLGGSLYQADSNHCFIFSLNHLLTTAKDESFYPFFKSRLSTLSLKYASEKDSEMGGVKIYLCPWHELLPAYNLCAQSFSAITSYVDHVRCLDDKEINITAKNESKTLVDAEFDIQLAKSLDCNQDGKIQNLAIEQKAIYFSEVASAFIESKTSDELIEICYKNDYFQVYDMFKASKQTERKLSIEQTSHPLLKLFFSNQFLLNIFLVGFSSQKKTMLKSIQLFYTVLVHKSFIKASEINLIDPIEIFKLLTNSDGKTLQLNNQTLEIAYKNIDVLTKLIQSLSAYPSLKFNKNAIKDLFVMKNADLFFSFSPNGNSSSSSCAAGVIEFFPLRRLYIAGQIDNEFLSSIQLDKLKKVYIDNDAMQLSDEALKEKILTLPIFKETLTMQTFKEAASSPDSVACDNLESVIPRKDFSCRRTLFSPLSEIEKEIDSAESENDTISLYV